ncbi:MAG: hypothetical protein D4R64_16115 [Porphyromonadaceae bacterium]|nr:MAG: hypothetical protein D4R64_16115 [Porphyromonadaceae bacterium]
MRKLGIIIILVICSCETEFYPYDASVKPIPIVFGMIDTNDSIHSIRLTKTFSGTENAYKLAKDTLNLLYDSVRMIIECLDGNLKVIDSLIFHKTYFIPPSSGIFNTGKGWYYVSTDKFPSADSFVLFRLKVWIYDSGDTIVSRNIYTYSTSDRTQILSPSKISQYISVYNESVTTIAYRGHDICGIKLRLHYFEIRNDTKTDKSIEEFWLDTNGSGAFRLTPARLFMFIRNTIPENPDVDFRIFSGLDIFSYAAPKAFVIYNQLFNTDRSFYSDITFFETPYSDITNGYGLFYEYTKDSIISLKFDEKTLDSLASGQYTKKLKFVSYQ